MSVDYTGTKTAKSLDGGARTITPPGAPANGDTVKFDGTAPVGVLGEVAGAPSPLFTAILTAAIQHSGLSYYGHVVQDSTLKSRIDYIKKTEEKILRLWAQPIMER